MKQLDAIPWSFTCPGLDNAGCGAHILIALQSASYVHVRLKQAGWSLAAGVNSSGTHFLDPMCPSCTGSLARRILDTAGGAEKDPGVLGQRRAVNFLLDLVKKGEPS